MEENAILNEVIKNYGLGLYTPREFITELCGELNNSEMKSEAREILDDYAKIEKDFADALYSKFHA